MKKLKTFIKSLGCVVATFLMLGPFYIIMNYQQYDSMNFWFYLICAILYDIYFYSVIEDYNYIDNDIATIEKIIDGKYPSCKSKEDESLWYEVICKAYYEHFKK